MMNKTQSARVHLIRFLFLLPLLVVVLLAFRNSNQERRQSQREKQIKTDTLPTAAKETSAWKDVDNLHVVDNRKVTIRLKNGKVERYDLQITSHPYRPGTLYQQFELSEHRVVYEFFATVEGTIKNTGDKRATANIYAVLYDKAGIVLYVSFGSSTEDDLIRPGAATKFSVDVLATGLENQVDHYELVAEGKISE